MNASEYMYWWRSGGTAPLSFGATEFDPSKRPSPFAVAASGIGRATQRAEFDPSKRPSPFALAASGLGRTVQKAGQVVKTITPTIAWSPEQKAQIKTGVKQITRPIGQLFQQAGKVVKTVTPKISFSPDRKRLEEQAAQIEFKTTPAMVKQEKIVEAMGRHLDQIERAIDALPYQESFGKSKEERIEKLKEKVVSMEGRLGGLEGRKAKRLKHRIHLVKMKIRRFERSLGEGEGGEGEEEAAEAMGRQVDQIERAVDALPFQEVFGGKEKRLARLEDKLLVLEEKAEGLEGKKAARLQRKIERVKRKIKKLGGEVDEDDEDEDEEEEAGDLTEKEAEKFGVLVDQVDRELDGLDDETFGVIGIDDAIIVGASAAVPALALALKSKPKRLEALKKRLDKLEGKLVEASGKKADRIQKKIDRVNRRIEKLEVKIERKAAKKEAMGLYSTYTFVPAGLEEDSLAGRGVLGSRRGGVFGQDPRVAMAVEQIEARWLGRAGVTDVRADMSPAGSIVVVSTVTGIIPSGFPRRVDGIRVVVVKGTGPSFGRQDLDDVIFHELFGSVPVGTLGEEGPQQLWPAEAATADEGSILMIPSTAEGLLSQAAQDGAWEGVQEFLGQLPASSFRRSVRRW